jgi:hypothetical protein
MVKKRLSIKFPFRKINIVYNLIFCLVYAAFLAGYIIYNEHLNLFALPFLIAFLIYFIISDYMTVIMKEIEFDDKNLYIREKKGQDSIVPIHHITSIKRFMTIYYRIRFDTNCPYPKKTIYFIFTYGLHISGSDEVRELKKLMKHVKTN